MGGEEDYDVGAVVSLAVVRQLKHVVLRHVRLNDEDVGVVAALHHFCGDVFCRSPRGWCLRGGRLSAPRPAAFLPCPAPRCGGVHGLSFPLLWG